MTGGLLHRGSAAEIEVPTCHGGGPAGDGGPFQNQDMRAGRGRGDRRAAAADTETDHHHVDVIGPFGHRSGVDGFWNLESAHSDEDIAGAATWLERVLVRLSWRGRRR